MPLGEPVGVLDEQEVTEDGEVDVEHRRSGQRGAVAGGEAVGEAEVSCEAGQLFFRGDLGAAADGVEEPVLLRGVADQEVDPPAQSRGHPGEGVGGQDVAVEDGGVEPGVVVPGAGGRIAPVGVDDRVGGEDQGLGARGREALGRGGAAGRRGHLAGGRDGDVEGVAGAGGAVEDGPAEQTASAVHHHEAGDGGGS
ncbi:hypothetical protein AMK29_15245 [Streptomyces sp. CB02261]|nr:hypothetical protein AMK29_15245 [Streptomyces sp. CB02261]